LGSATPRLGDALEQECRALGVIARSDLSALAQRAKAEATEAIQSENVDCFAPVIGRATAGSQWRRKFDSAGLSAARLDASLARMDAEASPSRSISTHLRGALSACRGAWVHAARLALDIALPTLCVACREPVDGDGVCAECWAKLSFIAPTFCPRLGIPFVYDPGPGLLSMEAISDPPAYQRARAAVRYDDVARTLVHALKYQDRTDLAPAMGRWMARAGRELLEEADALVPVPLHWRRTGFMTSWD
jgi:predicted amidophosphoribosyltransferase